MKGAHVLVIFAILVSVINCFIVDDFYANSDTGVDNLLCSESQPCKTLKHTMAIINANNLVTDDDKTLTLSGNTPFDINNVSLTLRLKMHIGTSNNDLVKFTSSGKNGLTIIKHQNTKETSGLVSFSNIVFDGSINGNNVAHYNYVLQTETAAIITLYNVTFVNWVNIDNIILISNLNNNNVIRFEIEESLFANNKVNNALLDVNNYQDAGSLVEILSSAFINNKFTTKNTVDSSSSLFIIANSSPVVISKSSFIELDGGLYFRNCRTFRIFSSTFANVSNAVVATPSDLDKNRIFGTYAISNSTFIGCSSNNDFGSVADIRDAAHFQFDSTTVKSSNNTVAIVSVNSQTSIFHSEFSNNAFGAIYIVPPSTLSGRHVFVRSNAFNANKAFVGGAIFVEQLSQHDSIVEVRTNNFTKNTAEFGGAIFEKALHTNNDTNLNLVIINNNFNSNFASTNGGAISISNSVAEVTKCTFNQNASPLGDDVYCSKSSVINEKSSTNSNEPISCDACTVKGATCQAV